LADPTDLKMKKQEHVPLDISVDCVVFGFADDTLKLLLIEQKLPDTGKQTIKLKKQMAIPGDLVFAEESLDDAAARVLAELTKLSGIYLKQFQTFGDPNRVRDLKDQEWLRAFRANPERRVVTVAYYSLVSMEDFKPKAASFAGKAHWVDVYSIPKLAFDHNQIVDAALKMLRHELMADHIGFELLPEKFTLSKLQKLYEIILDKKLDKRNFRKNIMRTNKVKPLKEKQKGVLHKPAQLFSADKKKQQG
jgi:8-oxo-dGTP diphosphatase